MAHDKRAIHMDLQIRELHLSDEHLVSALGLDQGQKEFSGGPTRELLDRLRSSPHPFAVHPFIVVNHESTIGFFVLREAPALPAWAMAGVMTLHNFRIGTQFQRQGLGSAAVRKAAQWVGDNRPGISRLMLSVNTQNKPAAALYQSCGFSFTGASFEGRIGRERIMAGDIATIRAEC